MIKLSKIKTKHLLLEAMVNGKKANLILDTGASTTVIDFNKSKKYSLNSSSKLDQEAQGIGEGIDRYNLNEIDLSIDGVLVNTSQVTLIDLEIVNKSIQAVCGDDIEISGVLGADVLWNYKAKIDYQAKKMYFQKGVLVGKNVEIKPIITGHLLVDTMVNGKSASLILDTGASDTVMDFNKRKYFGFEGLEKSKEEAKGLGTGSIYFCGGDENFSLGGQELNINLVMIDLSHVRNSVNRIYKKNKKIDGILGADVLIKYGAIIDYKTKELTLSLD